LRSLLQARLDSVKRCIPNGISSVLYLNLARRLRFVRSLNRSKAFTFVLTRRRHNAEL
jgi:hypothetical protein